MTRAQVAVGLSATASAGPAGIFDVFIYTSSGGTPGSPIEEIGSGLRRPDQSAFVTANSINTPILLSSGAEYSPRIGPGQH